MTGRPWELRTLDREAVAGLQEAIAEDRASQLEQEAALDGEEWDDARCARVLAAQMKEAALLAGLLAARGMTQPEEALSFLAGEDALSDPFQMQDMDKAVARIRRALEQGETIVIYGDYDVDGVTATSLLYEQLKGLGGSVKCMLPSREGDGYGLSKRAIDKIHDKGYTLIVTVDNGISAVDEAAYAASLGIDLVITDHHLSPFKDLCGAGVAFKLCAALEDCMPEELLEFCSDLAAIGTVADVMPLTGENRTIVKAGLQRLQHTERPGLAALLEEVGLAGRPVTADNVSFGIAPRLNAAGRMDSAAAALQLVLCEDPARAAALAHQLNEINARRQETEQKIEKAVEEMLAAEPGRTEDRIMLLWGRGWHQGVIGIVASRLVEKYGRPVMIVSIADNGEAKGSGRSVPGFNLHGCITACADLLIRFGGHAMAAGLLVREENLPELRRRMNEWAARDRSSTRPRWSAICRCGWPGSRWRKCAPWTGWPPLGPKTRPRSFCWNTRWWMGSTPSRRASTAGCGCIRAPRRCTPSGSGWGPSRCPTSRGTRWTPPSACRCTRGRGGPRSRAGSSTSTRRGWGPTPPARPLWWTRCAGGPPSRRRTAAW